MDNLYYVQVKKTVIFVGQRQQAIDIAKTVAEYWDDVNHDKSRPDEGIFSGYIYTQKTGDYLIYTGTNDITAARSIAQYVIANGYWTNHGIDMEKLNELTVKLEDVLDENRYNRPVSRFKRFIRQLWGYIPKT